MTDDLLAQRIAERLERLGWSQAELARRAGVHKITINRYLCRRRRHLRSDTMVKIADACGLRLNATRYRQDTYG